MSNLYRLLPSTDTCLQLFQNTNYPHTLLRNTITIFLDNLRAQIKSSQIDATDLNPERIQESLYLFVEHKLRPSLQKIINATGVVIHTNLGRSTLAKDAIEAVRVAASSYCNLEFDLETGQRGSRHSLVEADICALTGAESALVVNNNAAAVFLMLNTLCFGGEALVSRGQLVEIGGSFRIPDVMEKSGCTLKEVGTTNRSHLADYENAINYHTKAILKVHTSNYRIIGFHKDVATEELAKIAKIYNLPLLEDLGSGSFVDFSPYGLTNEPTVKSILQAGVDVVTFSGDKVLGGPQAGIIAGKKIYIDAIKKNQLLRALRCDKLTLAALAATLRLYYEPTKALQEIPTLRRMTIAQTELLHKAHVLYDILQKKFLENSLILSDNLQKDVKNDTEKRKTPRENKIVLSIKTDVSRVGGGSFPEKDLPTSLVCLDFKATKLSTQCVRTALLHTNPPLVGRIENDCFMLDVRTIEEEDFTTIAELFISILR